MEKKRDFSALENLYVEKPCSEDWNAMEGDERERHCKSCNHAVLDLSSMTREEAEAVVTNSSGRLCVRYTVDDDGALMNKPSRKPFVWMSLFRLNRVARWMAVGLSTILPFVSLGAGQKVLPKPGKTTTCPTGRSLMGKLAVGYGKGSKPHLNHTIGVMAFRPRDPKATTPSVPLIKRPGTKISNKKTP
jgi:hypothetical protein